MNALKFYWQVSSFAHQSVNVRSSQAQDNNFVVATARLNMKMKKAVALIHLSGRFFFLSFFFLFSFFFRALSLEARHHRTDVMQPVRVCHR